MPALMLQEVGPVLSDVSNHLLTRTDDKDSLKRLNDKTLQNVKHEKLRLLYVAAQIADIDQKINCAILETMKIYKRVLGSTTALGAAPGSALSNRTASAVAVCRAIVQCFGIPTVSYQTVFQILRYNVLDDLINNISVMFGEAIAVLGMIGTIGSLGMPVFLAASAVNIPLVVPATMRLMLVLATDLILILVRCFKEMTFRCIGQPLLQDVQDAAIYYASVSSKVHKEVLELVPKTNVVKSFKYHKVQLGLERIVHSFKDQITKDVGKDDRGCNLSVPTNSSTTSFSSDRSYVKAEVEDMRKIFKAAQMEIQEVQHTTTTEPEDQPSSDGRALTVTVERTDTEATAAALDEGSEKFRA